MFVNLTRHNSIRNSAQPSYDEIGSLFQVSSFPFHLKGSAADYSDAIAPVGGFDYRGFPFPLCLANNFSPFICFWFTNPLTGLGWIFLLSLWGKYMSGQCVPFLLENVEKDWLDLVYPLSLPMVYNCVDELNVL